MIFWVTTLVDHPMIDADKMGADVHQTPPSYAPATLHGCMVKWNVSNSISSVLCHYCFNIKVGCVPISKLEEKLIFR